IGDFAFAVWDRKTNLLSVARDATAQKPALLGRARDRVTAGSSMRMLLADPELPREIDDDWVAAYLTGTPGFARATGYRAIERLEPGHSADAAWRQTPWWSWSFRRVVEPDDEAYAARLRALLVEATRCRIDGATLPAISLSGGMDSTSVAAAMRLAHPDKEIVAVAVPFDDPRADEQALQQAMAERIGARLRWAPLTSVNPFGSSVEETLRRFGTPPVAPNHFFIDAVATAAESEGADVALDGIDGDGALAGNWNFLSDLLVRGDFRSFRSELRETARQHHVPRGHVMKHYVLAPLIPAWLKRAVGRNVKTPDFIDEDFARRTGLARRLNTAPWAPGRLFPKNERLSVDPGVAPAVLELIDELWALRGIEVAHPFGDRRLVQFCLGLPREQKVRGGMTKIVLRNAVRDVVPSEVVDRAAKAEMGSAFVKGLLTEGKSVVQEGLSSLRANPSPWTNPTGAGRLAERYGEGHDAFDALRVAFVAEWRGWISAVAPSNSV
ncbi:MAG TPA: asparagine synthase-related protein, partial [Actinomycetota bacterium]|nr:asparagine synthase-related protein [Actinomycetota bacterium]